MNQQHNEQSNLHKLHILAYQLSELPANPQPLLRDYISIYVQSHHLSDEYFTTLCEHRFMILMLENSNKVTQSTCILECLNLLLANTKLSPELAYFLSQNAMHDYLFGPNILQKDTDFIQYYVQLLKTILMKISEHEENKPLIRMFCNNKYPTFPLLTYTTILAGDPNELIKVTAQQCILILVGLINQKKIYSIYLSEPPILSFIVRLATQFLKPTTDHEGICRYLADLMYELRSNRIPLLLISNILCNVIMVSSLPYKTSIALSFVQLFSKCIQIRVLQHKGLAKQANLEAYYKNKNSKKKYYDILDESACQNLVIICSTYYRVLIKYMTNKYINANYLAGYISLCPGGPQDKSQTNLPLKIVYPVAQSQCKILQDYSLKKYIDQEHATSEMDLGHDFLDEIQYKLAQYCSSKEFVRTKENYYKKISSNGPKVTQNSISFFGRIFNRGSNDQLNNQYIKHVSDFASVNFVKGQPISLNFPKQLIPTTCPFFSEYINLNSSLSKGLKFDSIKTGQQSDTCETNQIHFNDIRSLWTFNTINLEIIAAMAKRFIEFINQESNEVKSLIVPKMFIPPCYLFLGQLKDYLNTSIHQHINKEPKNYELVQSMPMLICLSKICTLLNVKLNETSYICLASQLATIHQQLQTCLFQNGFKDIVEYIKAKNKITTLELEDKFKKSKSMENNNSDKSQKKVHPIKIKVKPNITFLKLCVFESIQKIMDPHMKPLNKHFETKWRLTFTKVPTFFEELYEQTLRVYRVSYFGKSGCLMSFIKLMIPPTIVLRVQLNGKKLLQIDLLQLQGIKRNTIDNRVLQFGGDNVENVKTESTEMADDILAKFKQYKFIFEQCVTNATLQYLSSTNQSLNLKGKKMGSSSRFSASSTTYQTPR